MPGRRYDVSDFVSLKAQMNLASEPGMSHGMLDVDLKARRLLGLLAQVGGVACGHEEGGMGAAMSAAETALYSAHRAFMPWHGRTQIHAMWINNASRCV